MALSNHLKIIYLTGRSKLLSIFFNNNGCFVVCVGIKVMLITNLPFASGYRNVHR